MKNVRELMVLLGSVILIMAGVHIVDGCSAQEAKTAKDVAIKVADETCKELETQPEPEWLALACAAEGVAGGVVKVLMPRAEWRAIRARAGRDAGPGK